jgi:hypothetical protein
LTNCLFSNRKCTALEREKRLKTLYETDIEKFIHTVCSMCIKKQYANAKERISRKKYVVVNTL